MNLNPELIPEAAKIKNIIFDWGGIITNIDYSMTTRAFERLGLNDFENIYTQLKQIELFDLLETGRISPEDFRNEIRIHFPAKNISDEDIDAAWTMMLLDSPRERIALLKQVKESYKTFLLSNTNAIHYSRYSKVLMNEFGFKDFAHLFEKVYLSHELGMRKPDKEIFEHVLKDNNLKADETLFIDDTIQHIEGAKKAGVHAFHCTKPITVLNLFSNGEDKN